MSSAGRWKTRRTGLPALIVPAMLAALMGAPALPVRAQTISFNPDGTGTGSGVINGVQNFNYNTGNVLALGGAPLEVGKTFDIFFQSSLASATGVPGGATLGADPGTGFTDGNHVSSGTQFTVVAGFQVTVTGITPAPGQGSNSNGPGSSGGSSDAVNVTFSPVANPPGTGTAAPNFFRLYAVPAGSAVPDTGAGFTNGSIILSGHMITAGTTAAFKEDGSLATGTFVPHTENFNQVAGSTSTVATPSTITGTGSTNLNVQVDSSNSNYFPTAPINLFFTSTNTLAFKGVSPSSGFFDGDGTAPDLLYPANFNPGTINGVSGPDAMFQAVAQNSFLVPEPTTIIPALTAAAAVPSFLLLRRWRRDKSPVVA